MPLIHCDSLPEARWLNEDEAQYVLSNGVYIWRLQLSGHYALIPLANALLNTEEQRRAASYHQKKDMRRFILSRAALRCVLSRYTGIAPAALVFATGSNRKPYLEGPATPVHYNVAHAGDYVLIAVSDSAVGVDTEFISRTFHYSDILESSFSAEERAAVMESPDPAQRFYQCWTRKEALLKATGKGMDDDLPNIPSLDGNHEVPANIAGSEQDWNVLSFDVDDNNMGCVAYDPSLSIPLLYTVQHITDNL